MAKLLMLEMDRTEARALLRSLYGDEKRTDDMLLTGLAAQLKGLLEGA